MARMAAQIKPGMTDREFIQREIRKWLTSPERLRQLDGEMYYDGDQSILQRKREAIDENGNKTEIKNLPNNKLVDNQFAKLIDQKSNYLCGKPFVFDTDMPEYAKILNNMFGQKMRRMFRILAEKAYMGGKVWVFPYYNDRGELDFSVFPAYEVLPFWSDAEHTELDCAVHLYPVFVYNEHGEEEIVTKAEVIHANGIDRFIYDGGVLIDDNDEPSGPFITVKKNGKTAGYNWERMPLICFKANHREQPLLNRVRCLQDALNLMLSDFVNKMQQDVHNTVLVLKNYDGEDLGQFRYNLETYGAVKINSYEGSDGGIDTLSIEVNPENYKTIIEILKKTIIEGGRGYDSKDDRLSGNPNQLNIRSMYSDVDLDANSMETEFKAAFDELKWFINVYLSNAGIGDFENERVDIIFDRDILVNETESIDNCGKSAGILSKETIVKQHPWVEDAEKELERIAKEEEDSLEQDPYKDIFEKNIKKNHNGIEEGGAEIEE